MLRLCLAVCALLPFAPRALAGPSCPTLTYQRYVLPSPRRVPSRFDLREQGLVTRARDQGPCASCWAFAAAGLFEALILRDMGYYSSSPRWAEAFSGDATSLHVSEQFLINNTRTGGPHCGASNAAQVVDDLANGRIATLELEANVPYLELSRGSGASARPSIPIKPTLTEREYLAPIWISHGSPCDTAVVKIYDDATRPWGAEELMQIKRYIARGIPVLGSMLLSPDSPSFRRFLRYKRGIFRAACPRGGGGRANHNILWVGYGEIAGEPVLVGKQSWGEDWGDNGFFYVSERSDTLCTEHYAYTALPRYFTGTSDAFVRDPALHKSAFSAEELAGPGRLDPAREQATWGTRVVAWLEAWKGRLGAVTPVASTAPAVLALLTLLMLVVACPLACCSRSRSKPAHKAPAAAGAPATPSVSETANAAAAGCIRSAPGAAASRGAGEASSSSPAPGEPRATPPQAN